MRSLNIPHVLLRARVSDSFRENLRLAIIICNNKNFIILKGKSTLLAMEYQVTIRLNAISTRVVHFSRPPARIKRAPVSRSAPFRSRFPRRAVLATHSSLSSHLPSTSRIITEARCESTTTLECFSSASRIRDSPGVRRRVERRLHFYSYTLSHMDKSKVHSTCTSSLAALTQRNAGSIDLCRGDHDDSTWRIKTYLEIFETTHKWKHFA